ncbi:MAG TPA: hypothetical protein DEQ14_03245 [Treponema sp.]|nr:hypothetical protein [Treponema sp.]
MQKAKAFFLIFLMLIASASFLCAQEESEPDYGDDEEIPVEPDWGGDYIPPLYSRGDKTFTISAGMVFPTLFMHQGKAVNLNMFPVGGTGSLAFSYFFDSHFSVGGEVGGLFNSTLAKNSLFIVPIGLRVGYQFFFWKMEFPLSLAVGIAPTRYITESYLGFFMKGGGAAYYRFSPDWSFGLNLNWGWYPQWTKEPEKDIYGNILDVTLSARYHF